MDLVNELTVRVDGWLGEGRMQLDQVCMGEWVWEGYKWVMDA